MKKLQIKNIEIWYQEKNEELEEFLTILKYNYSFFESVLDDKKIISFIKSDNENVLYLEKPLDFLDSKIQELISNDNVIKSFDNASLEMMYISFLLRKLDNGNIMINIDRSIPDEQYFLSFYYVIAYHYFKERQELDKYIDYIKYHKEHNEILKWFIKKVRFTTINLLLEELTTYFDEFFIKNISEINKIIDNEINLKNMDITLKEKEELPILNIDELYKLFREFLEYIKAPKDWIIKFEELKKNNKISFQKRIGNDDLSKCFKDSILIDSDGTIRSFISFVHEFMHYVSWIEKASMSNYGILELPSIFFERIGAWFLITKGYNMKILNDVLEERNSNNLFIALKISSVLNTLEDYLKNGEIDEDNELKKIKKYVEKTNEDKMVQKAFLDMYSKMNMKFDAESILENKIDALIQNIIIDGPKVVAVYRYIISNYLCDEILRNSNTMSEVIDKMISIINNFKEIGIEDILEFFNIKNFKEKVKKI